MVHFMAKWSHFYNLPAAFLNIPPKADMLNISFFVQTFVIMPKKNDNF